MNFVNYFDRDDALSLIKTIFSKYSMIVFNDRIEFNSRIHIYISYKRLIIPQNLDNISYLIKLVTDINISALDV